MNQLNHRPLATSPAAAAAAPSLLTQVGMAGSAAVITVTFIHPIDVVKVRRKHFVNELSSSSLSSRYTPVVARFGGDELGRYQMQMGLSL